MKKNLFKSIQDLTKKYWERYGHVTLALGIILISVSCEITKGYEKVWGVSGILSTGIYLLIIIGEVQIATLKEYASEEEKTIKTLEASTTKLKWLTLCPLVFCLGFTLGNTIAN